MKKMMLKKMRGNITIVVIGVIALCILGAIALFQFNKFVEKNKVNELNTAIVQLSYAAQGYADLNGRFNFDSNNLLNIVGKKYFGENLQGPLKGGVNVGTSTLSIKPDNEYFITIKNVPVKICKMLVPLLNENFDVIAIGANSSNNIGTNTGTYVKNIYGNRIYKEDFVNNICEKEAINNKEVNITTWVNKNNVLTINGMSVDKYNHINMNTK